MSTPRIPSHPISSSQVDVHPDLIKLVQKHQVTEYKRPIASHTLRIFKDILPQIKEHESSFILDSGCGTGMSTLSLAEQYSDCWILGVDKSAHRLHKAKKSLEQKTTTLKKRVCFIQADLIDFWRLLYKYNVSIHAHYILYPNPWPKKPHIQRRFHGHPIFPLLLDLAPKLELRSNWRLYLEEFMKGTLHLEPQYQCTLSEVHPTSYLTAFEKKYVESKQQVWKLCIEKDM
jgi:tRNA (guanine-N7-)-methyltransferase